MITGRSAEELPKAEEDTGGDWELGARLKTAGALDPAEDLLEAVEVGEWMLGAGFEVELADALEIELDSGVAAGSGEEGREEAEERLALREVGQKMYELECA